MTAWGRIDRDGGPIRPTGQPCRICDSDPEQRHRTWDCIAWRWAAGETLADIAADYAITTDVAAAVIVAQSEWLREEARWWAETAVAQIEACRHSESQTAWRLYGRITVTFPWRNDSQ